jgi:hypothetical protein
MNVIESFISPGIVIAFWIIVPSLLVGAGLVVLYYRIRKHDFSIYHTHGALGFTAWFIFAAALTATVILALVLIPWQPKYWNWYKIEAQVTDVTNKFESGTGDLTSGGYVLTIEGLETPLLTYDPRASQIEGEDVELLCTLDWVDFGHSADKWRCSIASY